MFASHFARAKAAKRKNKGDSLTKANLPTNKSEYKNKDNNNTNKGEKHSTRNDKPKEQARRENHEMKRKKQPDAAGNEQNKPRKRRRHEQRGPRRSRPTPQALDLSSRLQDLSRQKNLKELTQLFWKKENDKIRDSHHVCIVVDCCSRCGDVDTAQKAFASLAPEAVTVETKTALLKCYAHSGELHKAMHLFREMCQHKNNQQKPNVRTLNTLLRGCLWTAATKVVDEKGKAHVAGGVVSSEEGWILYQNLHKGEENNTVDTSSYEITIILLCQALRVDEAQARIQQLQEQYQIKCKGKASIKGGDQGSLETCGIAYLSLARGLALLGRTDDMWLACQRCLHAIQASLTKLEQDDGTQSKDQGGKRAWKVDASEEGQKRVAANLAYRKHRLTEVENEARALLKRRTSAKELSSSSLIPRLQSKLLYFTGGGTINSASTVSGNKQGFDAVWHSFGLEELANNDIKSDTEKQTGSAYRPPLTKHGHVDLSKVFSKERKKNVTDIEIGSGFGDWIVRQALSFPDRNHFAVELRADRVSQIFSRGTLVGAEPMDNLCTVGGDSAAFLRDSIAKGTIASVFCNHPEPPTQTLGQNLFDLEGLMKSSEDEPVHMLDSTTLGHATEALVPGGRLVIVTDNRNYGNLLCATIVRLVRNKKGVLRCLEHSQAKKMKLKQIESFPEHVVLYEGQPCLQLGHARDDMLAGQSYFDRLWKTGAGSHSETSRRYLIVMYKQ